MKNSPLWALFALPVAALVMFFGESGGGGPPVVPKGKASTKEAAKQSGSVPVVGNSARHFQPSGKPLEDSCELLSHYLDIPAEAGRDEKRVCGAERVRQVLNSRTLKVLLVTIPDPSASSLALETDRALDAVRLAMSELGFVPYKSTAFPWAAPEKKTSDGQPENSTRSDRAGAWLFRHKNNATDLRLVFLVGDVPESGISKPQFNDAIRQTSQLFKRPYWTDHRLAIVGPVFSGSVSSLGTAIAGSKEFSALMPDHVISGPTSNRGLANDFEAPFHQLCLVPLEFIQLNETASIDKLRKHLGAERTAVLSEADTVYGQGGRTEDKPILREFRYSRGLLNLRAAYASDLDLMSRIFPKSVRPNQLALSLGSGRNQFDSLPIYAPENLAVSQQITLRHLANYISRSDIENLIIVGSDPLDTVFLARFFQEEAPNLRLAVPSSDVLFDREAGAVSLRGMITLSKQFTGAVSPYNEPGEFPSDTSYLIYRSVLQAWKVGAEANVKSNTFLSVVGFDGEWPVALFKEERQNAGDQSKPPRNEYPKRGPLFAFFLVTLVLALGPACAWWILSYPSKNVRLQSVGAALLPFFPFCAKLRLRSGRDDSGDPDKWRRRYLSLCVLSGAISFLSPLVLVWVLWSRHGGGAGSTDSSALFARYLSLSNGVSPLLPLYALLFTIHACVWSRVRSHFLQIFSYHFFSSGLLVAKDGSSDEVKGHLDVTNLQLGTVRSAIGTFFGGSSFLVMALIGGAMLAYSVCVRGVEFGSPSENGWYSIVFTALFFVSMSIILLSLLRIWALWSALRKLLRRLEYHPLRMGFTRLPDRLSWTSIWAVGGLRPTMVSLQMTGDYLVALLRSETERRFGFGKGSLAEEMKGCVTTIDALMSRAHRQEFLTPESDKTVYELFKVRASVAKIWIACVAILEADVWPSQRIKGWQPDRSSFESKRPGGSETEGGGDKLTPVDERLAEFVALQYCAFIRYAFVHLRNLLGLLATALTLFFLSINVYPFEPSETLSGIGVILFCCSATLVISIFYQMDRDPLLSRLSNTLPGKLDAGFGTRLLLFGGLPAITFLASQFPPIGHALLSIAQIIPGLAKL